MSEDGWYEATPALQIAVLAAGLPMGGRDDVRHPRAAGPLIGTGLVVLDSMEHIHPTGLVFPIAEAGRLIGAMYEWASRNGLQYALESAVDQGRAWARRAPR